LFVPQGEEVPPFEGIHRRHPKAHIGAQLCEARSESVERGTAGRFEDELPGQERFEKHLAGEERIGTHSADSAGW
jgi:hypothetical protein